MKNIKEFKSDKEFEKYINDLNCAKLCSTSKSDLYISRDYHVIKDIRKDVDYDNLKISDVIMDSDYNLDSFIFPSELYVANDKIIGYKTNYFKGDVLESTFGRINIDLLVKAREKFIEDMKVMTDGGYYLYDIGFNILFDNIKMCAIDTLDYYKKNDVTLDENLYMLDKGLIERLYIHGLCSRNISYTSDFNKVITKIKEKSK